MANTRSENTAISRTEVQLLKGFGILLIVLHNFFHNLAPKLGENEFVFFPQLIFKYADHLMQFPADFMNSILSIWGHHGVELFILLSAYGTAISLTAKPISYSTFMGNKFKNLYLSFVICVLVYIALGILKQQLVSEQVLYWDALLWKLLLISNFIPGEALSPVGPWWFIPFIFQLYLIFPALLAVYHKLGSKALVAISIVAYVFEMIMISHWATINFSPFGHLPLICLGIYLSDKKTFSLSPWAIFAAAIVFIGAQFNFFAWLVGDIAITLLLVAFAAKFLFSLPINSYMHRFLLFLGAISLHLFLVNGFLRSPFKSISERIDTWWGDILLALCSFAFSVLFAVILKYAENFIRNKAGRLVPARSA